MSNRGSACRIRDTGSASAPAHAHTTASAKKNHVSRRRGATTSAISASARITLPTRAVSGSHSRLVLHRLRRRLQERQEKDRGETEGDDPSADRDRNRT